MTDPAVFSVTGYRGDALDARIQGLLEFDLNLDYDGTMPLPLKPYEVGSLWASIRNLIEEESR